MSYHGAISPNIRWMRASRLSRSSVGTAGLERCGRCKDRLLLQPCPGRRCNSSWSDSMIECNTFAIQEHKKIISSVQSYDIRNGETGDLVGTATEDIGIFTKTMRWLVSKQFLPTRVEVREKPDDSLVFALSRGWYLFRSRVEVRDAQGSL